MEATKLSLYNDDETEKDRAVSLLIHILQESLRLLHPFLSFITEEIYQKLPGVDGYLMLAEFPKVREDRNFSDEAELLKVSRR